MAQVVDVAALSREAKKYQPGLRGLPYVLLKDVLQKWGIRLLQVDHEDIVISFLRKAGLWRPYQQGTVAYRDQLAKIQESKLIPEMCYAAIKEHIDNYASKKVLNDVDMAGSGYLAKKKHKLERLLVSTLVVSGTEDLIPAIWFAKRDLADESPMGMFDGLHEIVNKQIVSGDIAVGNGNLISTGAIADPTTPGDETTAIEQAIAFVRSLSPFLKQFGSLYMSAATFGKILDALDNKFVNKDVEVADVLNYLNRKCDANLKAIHRDEALGTGDRIKASVPGNFDFGMNTFTDKEFVQIRTPFDDPNEFQFWMQGKFGTRIISTHKKVFAVNDQTQTAPSAFAGDY